MMDDFIKVVMGGSFDGMGPFADIIRVSKSGLDTGWMTKRAAVSDRIKDLKSEPGKTYVHLLALGDGETFGPNRNADFFSKAANQAYHKTFETHAKFYRHHNNKDPDKSFGDVKIAEYNPNMHRVELVIAMDNNKCAEELDLLEKKGSFSVSMACRVPYDVCSICGHKAMYKEAKFPGDPNSYCDHALYHLTKIASDGRQVYVDNPSPTFFDISRVFRPADRIAWTFEKVASDTAISGADLAAELGYSAFNYLLPRHSPEMRKKAEALNTLIKLEREFNKWTQESLSQTVKNRRRLPETTLTKLAEYCSTPDKLKAVLGNLTDQRILLTPYEFFKLAAGSRFTTIKPELDKVASQLPGIFSRITDTVDFCRDTVYDGTNDRLPNNLAEEIDRASYDTAYTIKAAQFRLIKSAADMPAATRREYVASTPAIAGIATEYAKYQLGFVAKCADTTDKSLLEHLTVTCNYVK